MLVDGLLVIDISRIPLFLRQSLRFRVLEPIRHATDIARSTIASKRRKAVHVLLVSDQASYTSEQQFSPLLAARNTLREQLGVLLHRQLVTDTLLLPNRVLQHYNIVLLKLGFRTPPAKAQRITQAIRRAMSTDAKLIYFDGDDDLCVQWPSLLSVVDLYVKKHCFRNHTEYFKKRVGKTNLTDYVAKNFGVSFSEDIIPTSEPVAEEQVAKIMLGWNIGLDDKIRHLYRTGAQRSSSAVKDIDVVCRANVDRQSWMYPLRAAVIPRINSLGRELRVLTPEARVPQHIYYEEMLRSLVCVSPFGYGEICWRDFEAVICGCVLVKPDMSHVQTEPDIYVADETYVAVRWDYSDLEAVVSQLLKQPERCARIRANALEAYRAYLEGNGVIRKFQEMLSRLQASNQSTQSASP